jgi:GAF domain-containing protein
VTSWSQWRRGRFWVEIVLAVLVGVAAFVVAAAVSTAARSNVPAVLLGLLFLLAVLAVARFAGILYALPVGVVTIEAFDWYFLPPLRNLDGATVLVLGLRVLHLDNANLIAYERDQTATVVGAGNLRGWSAPVGTRVPLEGDNIIGRVFRTQQSARIDDYGDASGPAAEYSRSMGVRAAAGSPVLVGGRLWGVMAVSSSRPLPADTEMRIGAFTELVATAIANTEARRELERVAAEQAALGRVATLVAGAVPPGEVFTAVAAEVAGLFGVPHVGLFRYDREGAATVIAGAGEVSSYLGRRWPCPAGDPGIVASVQRTGQPLRIDDYTQIRSAIAGPARELDIGMTAGVPVLVGGRVWGAVVVAAGYERPPLPADTLERLAVFTELMATAIANSEARTEIERLAQEQAALRRVATLVAQGADTGEVFAAVAREVAEVMHLPIAAVQRYDDETMTVIAAWSDRPHPFQPGTRWPFPRLGAGRASAADRSRGPDGGLLTPPWRLRRQGARARAL